MGLSEMNKECMSIKLDDNMLGIAVLTMSSIFSMPGWSTILAGYLAGGDKLKPAVIIGLIQVCTTPILVGWIWSIWMAWSIYKNSKDS